MAHLIDEAELECTYTHSSGPGGQNVNKVNSKCVLRWSPGRSTSLSEAVRARFLAKFAGKLTNEGDLVITGDRFRDQKKNYKDCIEKLDTMVRAAATPPRPRKATRPSRRARRQRLDSKSVHSKKKAARRKPQD